MQPATPKPKPYASLRGVLAANDFDQAYLVVKLRRSLSYVEARMTARAPWSQADIYKIMEMFHLPHDQLHVLFPPPDSQKKSPPPCHRDAS